MWEKHCTVEELYEREKDLKKEDILALQEWVNKQSHFPAINEFTLIFFLHACHYKTEPTKVCLEEFCTLRTHWPEFSQNRDVFSRDNQQALRAILVTVLPTKDNHMTLYAKLLDANVDCFNPMVIIRVLDMFFWMFQWYVGTKQGLVMIFDIPALSFAHLMKFNLVHLKKSMYYVQEALAVRLKAVHLINVTPMVEKFLAMVKPFMKKELMDMIHTHTKNDTFYQYVPQEALPEEYGGKAGTFMELQEREIRIFEENAQNFLDSEKMIADESKRQGKPKNSSDVFGIEGTFRKLDID